MRKTTNDNAASCKQGRFCGVLKPAMTSKLIVDTQPLGMEINDKHETIMSKTPLHCTILGWKPTMPATMTGSGRIPSRKACASKV